MAEVNYRNGRKCRDVARLTLAAKQDRYDIRAAIELSRMGAPWALGQSLMLVLAGLRDSVPHNAMDNHSAEFMEMVIGELEQSRGQCFQDVAALYFSNKKRDGFFVEVGTGNGEQLSNTFLLEKVYGWRGVLFEPDRRFHESIRKSRTASLDIRPVYSDDGKVMDFLEVSGAGELSTLDAYRKSDGRNRKGTSYRVETTTLNTALAFYDAPKDIDFISIDTEGSELEVLRGIDLENFNVRFLTIEHNYEEEKKQAICDYLQPLGYKPVLESFSQMDIWFVK